MSNYYIDTFKQALDDPNKDPGKVLNMIQNTDFFFKILRIKFESKNPVLIKEAIDEMRTFNDLLKTYPKM